ncbi:hypothetical protein P691DRAFT_758105 [Macrolepiota fuliginosa MF-IS2]|uniref:Uncharacterized protein n=1 Tax=Macrolepiota fuliginosa MF-IS2 TaxID=1400762 RepID=A0A9P5XJV2_9AGAR|nr:hypothetical protein P691DRAFT_758105 [Macrolepiota fuliginosa MF-IS2]
MADVAVEKPLATPAETEATGDDNGKQLRALRQVEFYFADSNLPYDKFMWTLHTKTPEHWIPIKTIASFKRMREYQSEGIEWLIAALGDSTFLELDESKTNVRRTTEVQEPKNQFERSIYAKGFSEEEPTLQARLEEFFNKYGRTNAVRMRRDEEKKFKGSVFVEFADFSTVEAFLKADPKPTWEEKELLIMSKGDYCEMKIKEKGLTGKAAKNRREMMTRTRGFNAFQETSKPKGDDKQSDGAAKEVFLDFMGENILIHKDDEGNGTVNAEDVPFVKSATLKFDGCGGDVSWAEIKEPLKAKFDNRAPYIKYSRGDDFGLVGFHKALSEEEIALVKETVKTINKKPVTWTVPNEQDEKAFQIERAQAAAKAALNTANGVSSTSARGGRGGRGAGRGASRGGRGAGRGGRGGARGGRGGRSGGDRNGRSAPAKEGKEATGGVATESKEEQAQAGEKRKRAIEPDGGHDVGTRGVNAPPTLASASAAEGTTKKVKTNDGAAAPAS